MLELCIRVSVLTLKCLRQDLHRKGWGLRLAMVEIRLDSQNGQFTPFGVVRRTNLPPFSVSFLYRIHLMPCGSSCPALIVRSLPA